MASTTPSINSIKMYSFLIIVFSCLDLSIDKSNGKLQLRPDLIDNNEIHSDTIADQINGFYWNFMAII